MPVGLGHNKHFRNKCDIVEEPNSSPQLRETYCFDEDMNQSESFVYVFRPWYDCQSNTEISQLFGKRLIVCIAT